MACPYLMQAVLELEFIRNFVTLHHFLAAISSSNDKQLFLLHYKTDHCKRNMYQEIARNVNKHKRLFEHIITLTNKEQTKVSSRIKASKESSDVDTEANGREI